MNPNQDLEVSQRNWESNDYSLQLKQHQKKCDRKKAWNILTRHGDSECLEFCQCWGRGKKSIDDTGEIGREHIPNGSGIGFYPARNEEIIKGFYLWNGVSDRL